MTSSPGQYLASYPCTAAGSRALADHLRDDHGKTLYTSPYEEDHAVHSAMHAAAHEADRGEPPPARHTAGRPHPACGPAPAGAEPAGDGSTGDAAHEHDWACVSPQHGPDATYRCRCGQTVPGSEIGVTEQARDWFYAPAGRRQARVTTHRRLPGYRRHNSAAARALARHMRGEGFESVDIDPGDPGAASSAIHDHMAALLGQYVAAWAAEQQPNRRYSKRWLARLLYPANGTILRAPQAPTLLQPAQ